MAFRYRHAACARVWGVVEGSGICGAFALQRAALRPDVPVPWTVEPWRNDMSFWNTCILAYCRLGIAGLSPKAPGTAGSALAALLAPLLFLPLPLWGRLLFLAVIVGVWIALLPLGAGQGSWPGLVWAFALFRLFDIWKPWPVHASENWLPAGWGIMLDDILAGLMAMCCMLVLRALGWV